MTDTRSQTPGRMDLLYLAAVSLFFLLYGLGSPPLVSWDEALYAGVAKEMVLSGDWFHLTQGGAPWLDKPPLAMWATAFFYKLFGINELSARLFSALCGVGAVLVTYCFATRLFNRWTGFLSALVLLSSSHFLRFARRGMLDAPLVLFLSLALYFFWRGKERNRYFIFSGLALGAALLIKGFAALIIFPVIAVYCLWADEWALLGRSSYWVGVMIAVAIAMPWNVFEMLSHQQEFMNNVVVKHLFSRTTSALDGHDGNWYFYIRTFINKYHPWVLVAIFSAPYFLYRALRKREKPFVWIATWLFVLLAIVTIIRTKLQWYILPLYPPLSITAGYLLARWLPEKRKQTVRVITVVLMTVHFPLSHLTEPDPGSAAVRVIAPSVRSQVPAGSTVFLYNYHGQPEAVFYFERKIRYVDHPDAFAEAARESGPFYCLIFEKDLPSVQNQFPAAGLSMGASAGGVCLVRRQ